MKRLQAFVVLFFLFFSLNAQNARFKTTVIESVIRSNIIDFIEASKDHSILLQALEITGLSEILNKKGPFTIFAPTNTAFKKLSKTLFDDLMQEKNKKKLKTILLCHIINENINTSEISRTISENNDEATYKTLNDNAIIVFKQQGVLIIEDATGKDSHIEIPDLKQNNGYIHIVDTVILPN